MKKESEISVYARENIADVVTKELISRNEEVSVQINIGQKRINSPSFVMVFQAVGLMVNKMIDPSSLAVFWHLISKLDYGNHVGVNQQTVSDEINMPLRTVEFAFKQLKSSNMIIAYKDPQDARRNIYIINPNIVWRGKEKTRTKLIKVNPAQFKLDI